MLRLDTRPAHGRRRSHGRRGPRPRAGLPPRPAATRGRRPRGRRAAATAHRGASRGCRRPGARLAPDGFEARFGALWRRYAYRVVDGATALDPLRRHEVLRHPRPLDVERLNQSAAAAARGARLRGLLQAAGGGEHRAHAARRRRGRGTTTGCSSRPSGPTRSATRWCARWWASCCPSARAGVRWTGPARSWPLGCVTRSSRWHRRVGSPSRRSRYPPDDQLALRASQARQYRG